MVSQASAALGTWGEELACGLPILPALAYTVTMDFHAAGETGPESQADSPKMRCAYPEVLSRGVTHGHGHGPLSLNTCSGLGWLRETQPCRQLISDPKHHLYDSHQLGYQQPLATCHCLNQIKIKIQVLGCTNYVKYS